MTTESAFALALRPFVAAHTSALTEPACAPLHSQKLPPFDEFTVFGLPSNAGLTENWGVRECMHRGELDSLDLTGDHLLPLPKKLIGQIEELESKLHGIPPINRYEKTRPITARLLEVPRVSPRATFTHSPLDAGLRTGSSTRRPVKSVSAYVRAGVDPARTLQPNMTARLEQWRSYPKYEEQMMLGILRSQKERLNPEPLWKLKRFDMVSPRF